MAAPKKSLPDIHRGDSRLFRFEFTDSADVAIDITGTTLWCTVKESQDDADEDAVLQKSVTFASSVDSTNGVGFMRWEATETEDFVPGSKYWYDFQWVNPSTTDVSTMGWGQIKVLQDVTVSTA